MSVERLKRMSLDKAIEHGKEKKENHIKEQNLLTVPVGIVVAANGVGVIDFINS